MIDIETSLIQKSPIEIRECFKTRILNALYNDFDYTYANRIYIGDRRFIEKSEIGNLEFLDDNPRGHAEMNFLATRVTPDVSRPRFSAEGGSRGWRGMK